MIELPIQRHPNHSQTYILGGVSHQIRFRYNPKERCWFIDFGIDLIGVKVVCGHDLLDKYRYMTSLPKGRLVAIDPKGLIETPDYAQLTGDAVKLIYDETE